MPPTQNCPICLTEVARSERYPRYVCGSCFAKAADEAGRPLIFSNLSLSGGFVALYADTFERRNTHICYIDGVRCRAGEYRFGGIIIEAYDCEQQ